jgi:hypothetical protein
VRGVAEAAPAVPTIGMLNERHLHAALKAHYLQPGDRTEAHVDGYVVDILRDGLIIEVQTRNFSKIARKMRDLVSRHRVRLVYPIARDAWIVKMPHAGAAAPTRRKSPKHGGVLDVFDELVSFPELVAHENFELDAVLIGEETVWRYAGHRRWRRRGWAAVERRLLTVYETVPLRTAADYAALLPPVLPPSFLTSDLAEALGCARGVAQKMAYCLRNGGLIEKVGSQGNAIAYARVAPATPVARAAGARRRSARKRAADRSTAVR